MYSCFQTVHGIQLIYYYQNFLPPVVCKSISPSASSAQVTIFSVRINGNLKKLPVIEISFFGKEIFSYSIPQAI